MIDCILIWKNVKVDNSMGTSQNTSSWSAKSASWNHWITDWEIRAISLSWVLLLFRIWRQFSEEKPNVPGFLIWRMKRKWSMWFQNQRIPDALQVWCIQPNRVLHFRRSWPEDKGSEQCLGGWGKRKSGGKEWVSQDASHSHWSSKPFPAPLATSFANQLLEHEERKLFQHRAGNCFNFLNRNWY